MRTEKNWNSIKWRYLPKFPLRVQKDLQQFENPKTSMVEDSIFIYGEVRTGKTILAAQYMMNELKDIYLNAYPDKHNRTIFVSFPDMLANIKKTFNSPDRTEDVMNVYMDAHMLVLDDFITTRPTDWVIEIIYHLINYRYENMKKTIITSNFSLDQLENILQDQRITSRIERSYTKIEKQPYETR